MSEETIEVRKVDLLKVCEAVIDEAKVDFPSGPYQSLETGCLFCSMTNRHDESFEGIKHADNCPYLVAKDIAPWS